MGTGSWSCSCEPPWASLYSPWASLYSPWASLYSPWTSLYSPWAGLCPPWYRLSHQSQGARKDLSSTALAEAQAGSLLRWGGDLSAGGLLLCFMVPPRAHGESARQPMSLPALWVEGAQGNAWLRVQPLTKQVRQGAPGVIQGTPGLNPTLPPPLGPIAGSGGCIDYLPSHIPASIQYSMCLIFCLSVSATGVCPGRASARRHGAAQGLHRAVAEEGH